MKTRYYASKRIDLLKKEMGKIESCFMIEGDKGLYVEFENGMNFQLHPDEITYQAVSYLEGEIEGLLNN